MIFQRRLAKDGWSIETIKERGLKLPDWYVNSPARFIGDTFYLNAYAELCTERHSTDYSVGVIPWSSIVNYARHHGINDDILESFIYIIREMEREDLSVYAEEQKKASDAAQRQNKRKFISGK